MGVVGGEQWPVGEVINFGQNDGDRRMIGDSFPTRRPSQRSATPHSSSINSSPSSGSSNLSRKQSLHGPDGEASKRPPREWRTDFSMTKPGMFGLGALFRSRSRTISSGHEAKNGAKPKLHPYLRFNSSNPNMHLDLRRSPNELRFRVVSRPINQWDMMRFACEPAQPHMRLYNAHFPWFIDVDSANPTGVTLFELFTAINVAMMTQISHADYWNTELDGQARERIAHAWSERCEDDEELRRGVKRVDFLMYRVILEGLAKGKDGMWEMKLSKLCAVSSVYHAVCAISIWIPCKYVTLCNVSVGRLV
ncbi:hypothetical protein A0H81_12165 [Grifola frondosa]|uniref:DUF6699 domain-containing protein n=1 Tax=Grifola frondosa TaxID=5627 RepID=A0A1C7LY16_GRIFR|nr:hypothetical protein A0H81_12165 [Grifola frondosa]